MKQLHFPFPRFDSIKKSALFLLLKISAHFSAMPCRQGNHFQAFRLKSGLPSPFFFPRREKKGHFLTNQEVA